MARAWGALRVTLSGVGRVLRILPFFVWEGGGVVASDKSVWCDRAPRALLSPVLTSSSGPVVARIKQRHAFDGSDCAQEICESDCAQDWNAVNIRGAGAGNEQSLTVYCVHLVDFYFSRPGARAPTPFLKKNRASGLLRRASNCQRKCKSTDAPS